VSARRSAAHDAAGSSRRADEDRAVVRPPRRREPLILLVVALVLLVVSRIGAYDPTTWVLEVFPIFLGVPLLVATGRRFPLTPLAYRLIFVHALILMLGGHYTYARVPLGFWLQDALHLARNHYDRIGHFAQGFVPAIVARELLLRRSPLVPGKWLFFLVTCVCLSISACYEFVEWWAAVAGGSAADAFLGTQGDVWDTQWDMFMALLGALSAQLLLAREHDRELAPLAPVGGARLPNAAVPNA
jgi:putative membrane protein